MAMLITGLVVAVFTLLHELRHPTKRAHEAVAFAMLWRGVAAALVCFVVIRLLE